MTAAATASPKALFDEVVAHYKACGIKADYLSDTWAHTLKQKGALFPLADLERMLELGNRVNTWIDDFNFLIDETALARADPQAQKLLGAGEPDFGRPRRDCKVGRRWFSSNFVHHVLYAGRIIAAIEARKLARPRILEIGGGLGGVAYLLKAYFGDRATYFAADLPEGLLLQEWYLRRCLPDAPTAHKAGEARAVFAEGGLNFINAFALETQDFPFDVAVNIDSMQEMNRTAIVGYLKFIERNISPRGLFYFQNHFGQASSPVHEPSEYPLDARWTIALAEVAPQLECCTGAEQARIIYYRSQEKEDAATRRLVLRALWNGFVSGRLPNDPALVAELAALARRSSPKEAVGPITAAFAKRKVAVSRDEVAALLGSHYFPSPSYVDCMARGPWPHRLASHEARMDALWRAQSGYLHALKAAGEGGAFNEALAEASCVLETEGDVSDSSFYSGYFASILFVLGRSERAEALLQACLHDAAPVWQVRFAELLSRFGRDTAARKVVGRLKPESLDWFAAVKAAELSKNSAALRRLDPTKTPDDARLLCWAKTAARLGFCDDAARGCAELVRRRPKAAPSLLHGVLTADPTRELGPAIQALAPKLGSVGEAEEFPMAACFLLLELGRRDEALARVDPLVTTFWGDYFRLGQLGRFFQRAGVDAQADKCLRRSIKLRPNAFLHFDFVGNVYFSASRFDRAAAAYRSAVELKPYLRRVLAKRYYSALPAEVRESGRFGRPSDLRLIFQSDQDFYHDLGPASK